MKKNKAGKSTLLSLFLIVFIDLLGLGIVIPLLPLIFFKGSYFAPSVTIGVRNALLGLLIAAYPLAQFFGAPILGRLSDRHGRKIILTLSLLGTFVGYVLFAFGIMYSSILILFISRLLDGFTGGNISVAMSSIADVSDDTNKVKNFGLIGMAFGLGFIFGPMFGGMLTASSLVSWFNYATPFWAAAILALFNFFFVLARYKETLVNRVHRAISVFDGITDIKKAMGSEQLRTVFMSIFLINFGWNFFTQFSQVFLYKRFNYTPAQIGMFFAYVGVWVAVSQGAIIRPLSMKYKPARILALSMPLTALIMITLLIPRPGQAVYLYLILPFLAIFYGFTQPNFSTIVSDMVGDTSQGEVMGIRQSVLSLSQAAPAIIAGLSITISVSTPILLSGATIFLAWITFTFFYKESSEEVYEF